MNVEVSVIIPVYNGASKLHFSIESVLAQTYKNYEIIVIDDGSQDNTLDLLYKYTETHKNIVIHSQANSGVAAARNKGIELARGKYISFLDADDFYDENYLKEMVAKIKSKNKEVCYCGYNLITNKEKITKKMKFTCNNILEKYILGKLSISTNCWLIEREFIIQHSIKFPIGVSWGEDFEFFCEVLSLTKEITFVDKYLTNYRVGFETNQLSSFSLTKIRDDYDSINRLVGNKRINNNIKIKNALVRYRLQALITYRLISAFHYDVNTNEIIIYYNNYKEIISSNSYGNGLRSLKLEVSKFVLKMKMRRLKSIN